jgi:hypothetical protein
MGDPIMQNVLSSGGGVAGAQLFFPRGYTGREVKTIEAERQANFDALREMMGRKKESVSTGRYTESGEWVSEPIIQGGEKDATEKREEPTDRIDEHIGVPQGKNTNGR